MSVAMLSAYRSKDPSRQVGACIVDPSTKRIVGIGYNGFPWGCSDEKLPWARKADSWLDTKYPYVCHAELNAIMNKNTASLEGVRDLHDVIPVQRVREAHRAEPYGRGRLPLGRANKYGSNTA